MSDISGSAGDGRRHCLPVRAHRHACAFVAQHERIHRVFFHITWASYIVHAVVAIRDEHGVQIGARVLVTVVEVTGRVLGLG